MLRQSIRRIKNKAKAFINKKAAIYCAKSPKRAALYYLLFNKAFHRELHSVLNGKLKHLHETEVIKANYFLLVRNTHRIEKGLLMRPRRPIFGKDYIEETVDSFEEIWKTALTNKIDNQQLKWFHDVLSEYFLVTDATHDALLIKLSERFVNIIQSKPSSILKYASTDKFIPYFRLKENNSNISYDEFYKLCKQRRSVRWFLDKPVHRELIDRAILAANQSPSACNRQPFEFRIFDQKELVNEGASLPNGTIGYAQNIPIFAVLVGNLDAYFDERDRHIIYIDASLAAMSFMLALETLGLGSCAINWPDIEVLEIKMAKFLNLNSHQRPIMCMGVGYADPEGMVAFSEKRTLNDLRKYNS
ncbi:nitroreductase family protein [Parapedobacter koreensis]|uniref:Nitroreductase n=1 Tax=Parapedobacter koreensis TaxID=332977 RepID=A0A1H7NQU1_9SPHI|nr:nitroreductase family protein [Parapedobacter koreensis]SEL25377.1 Nitroreductase [Parapedobacter koreensis]